MPFTLLSLPAGTTLARARYCKICKHSQGLHCQIEPAVHSQDADVSQKPAESLFGSCLCKKWQTQQELNKSVQALYVGEVEVAQLQAERISCHPAPQQTPNSA